MKNVTTYYIAIDPGKTCGVATLFGAISPLAYEMAPGMLLNNLDVQFASYEVEVICERFFLGQQALRGPGDAQETMGIIGAIKYLCDKHGYPLHMQSASEAKTLADDKRLKAMGLYHASPGGHANDAMRHLVTYLANQGKMRLK